jgi:hypothetical protein
MSSRQMSFGQLSSGQMYLRANALRANVSTEKVCRAKVCICGQMSFVHVIEPFLRFNSTFVEFEGHYSGKMLGKQKKTRKLPKNEAKF